MTFRGYGGGGPPSASSSYFGPHGPGDDRKSVASNVVAGGFRPSGYSDAREHDLVRGSGPENWNQSSYSSFKRSEDMLRVTVGNSLYVPPGSGGSTEADNGASSWGRAGGSAQFERTVESLGNVPGVPNDACNNKWNVPQPDFRQRNRALAVPEGGMHMTDSGVDDRWSGRAEAAASRGDLTRRGGPMPPAHSRGSERDIGTSQAARIDASVSSGFATSGRTSDFGGQRDKHSAVWRSADAGLYSQQSAAAEHLGSGAGLSAPKSILKSKPLGQSAMPAIATERMIPSAGGSGSLGHHHHVGSAAPDGSTARAALQAQTLLAAAAAAAASGAGSGGAGGGSGAGGAGSSGTSGSGAGGSSMSARAQVFDYGHSKPDVLFGNKATSTPLSHQSGPSSGVQGGPASTGPSANVGVIDGSGQTAAGRDLMQDPLFDSIIKSMGIDFDPKKKLQERARELEQQVEEAARRKRKEKTEEEMARQFGINKTASFLEGGDLDIGTVLGSSAALVTAAVRRSTDNDVPVAAHQRRNGVGAQSSMPEPSAAGAASIRDSHPDQESGKSRRGGASPSRKSQYESDAGGALVHVRDGRKTSDSSRSGGGVSDRYDTRLAGSSQREAAAGFAASERSPSGSQSSHYATRSSSARDVATEFPPSLSSDDYRNRSSGRDMADHRQLGDSHQASEAASPRTKGDRNTRSDAVDAEAQRRRHGSESNSGSSGSSSRVSTPGGCGTSETLPGTGALSREEHEQLKVEMEDRRRRLRLLEGELEKLRRQQNELMRKHQQRGGGVGRKGDPFIDENTRLQEDISRQIAQLRKTAEANERALAARLALSESGSNVGSASTKGAGARSDASVAALTVQASGRSIEGWGSSKSDSRDSLIGDDLVERLSSHFSRDQAKALSAALGDASTAAALFRTLLQVHPSLGESAVPTLKQPQPSEDRSASKSSSSSSAGVDGGIGRQPSRSAASGPSPSAEGVVYEYYDSSAHWCKPCNVEMPTLSALLEHLASDAHHQALEQPERPWASAMPRAPAPPSKTSKKDSATIIKLPLKGSEFVVPAPQACYCRLCSSFAGDHRCMEAHIKSSDHYETYKKYTSDNPYYERRYTLDREASARSRKRRQEEDARLADRAKRQRLDDELVNKKLEALKMRHRQTCGDAALTAANPDGAAAESVPEAAAKESVSNESPMPDNGDGCGSKTQRLDLHGVIKKESGNVVNSSLAAAAEPRPQSQDGVSTSKKMRLNDADINEASASTGAKEPQSPDPSNERRQTAAGSVHVAATSDDVGLPISVVVGKKSVSSTVSAVAPGVAARSASAAAATAALADATVGIANEPLTVAPGTGRQQKSPQQTKAILPSDAVAAQRGTSASASRTAASTSRGAAVAPVSQSTGDVSAGSDRGRLVDGGDSRASATTITTAAAAAARLTTASTKPATSPAQPGSLSASGLPQGPASRATTQTSKAAGSLISPSSNRAAAAPTAATTTTAAAAAAETGSKAASTSIGAVGTSGARPAAAAAAAAPGSSAAKTLGKSSGVQETTKSPSAGVVRPAAVVSSQPGSSVGTSPLHAAVGAASPKPPGLAAGCSRPQSADKAVAVTSVSNVPVGKSLPPSASKPAAPASGAAGPQQSRPIQLQQQQARSAPATASAGSPALVSGGGKPAGGLPPQAAAVVAGSVKASDGIGSSLATALQTAMASSAATSLPAPPPAAEQPPAAKSVPSPSGSSTCRASEPASSSSTGISQTTKVIVPAPITASQSAVDSKPVMAAAAALLAPTATAESATQGRATASAVPAADRTALRPSSAAKGSRPVAPTTTTAGQPAAKPGAATAASASGKPQPAAAKAQPVAGGRGLATPVNAASAAVTPGGASSNRTEATALAAVASADRARTTAAGVATVVPNSNNGKQPSAPPAAAAAPAARRGAATSLSASDDRSASKLPPAANLPASNVPRASAGAGQSKRPSSSPVTRQAAGNVSHTAMPAGGSRPAAAAAAVKPASASSVADGAATNVAASKPAGAIVPSVMSTDASDLEGDGSVSGADEGSADELSMDGDFEILDEYEELEEQA